jgi:hypothetical protein
MDRALFVMVIWMDIFRKLVKYKEYALFNLRVFRAGRAE